MASILLVHGINNTFGGPAQMHSRWFGPLADGVTLAGGPKLDPSTVSCVFYGDAFRPGRQLLGSDDDLPPLIAEDLDADGETDILRDLWVDAADQDNGVRPPDAETLDVRASARSMLTALTGARLLAAVPERFVIWLVKQVDAYLSDERKRAFVHQRFAEAMHDDVRVVVAHSLGSIVAYEALCAHPRWPVTHLVTLGSPLGIPTIRRRVTPRPNGPGSALPGGIQRWVNISDAGDFVALRPVLRDDYGLDVIDVRIDNGARAHQVERYLSARETGQAVQRGL